MKQLGVLLALGILMGVGLAGIARADGLRLLDNKQVNAGSWNVEYSHYEDGDHVVTQVKTWSQDGGKVDDFLSSYELRNPVVVETQGEPSVFFDRPGGSASGWGLFRFKLAEGSLRGFMPSAREIKMKPVGRTGDVELTVRYARFDFKNCGGYLDDEVKTCVWHSGEEYPPTACMAEAEKAKDIWRKCGAKAGAVADEIMKAAEQDESSTKPKK